LGVRVARGVSRVGVRTCGATVCLGDVWDTRPRQKVC
jgi:hypothetical protein